MAADEDEDDYLTMTFNEPASSAKNETLTQRKKRLARQAEERGRTKSKAQLAEEERAKRDEALQKTSIDTTSKGYKMMAALGYKPGAALGVDRNTSEQDGTDSRLLEPVGLEMKEDRSGIGANAEKKRRIREEFERREEGEKRQKVEADEYRERQTREREEKRTEGQLWGAMKVAEKLDEEDSVREGREEAGHQTHRLLIHTNVLWRRLVKQRAIAERDRRMRYDLQQSLSRAPTYDDPEEDEDDKLALSKKSQLEEVDVDLDKEDAELDEFETLDIKERLTKLVQFLRSRWHYCFWCKYQYPTVEMEGCPGETEDEHG